MKKLLIFIAFGLLFVGCHKTHHHVYVNTDEPEKIVVTEQESVPCGQPLTFKVNSEFETNVTIESENHKEPLTYLGENGVEIQYTVVGDCEGNGTNPGDSDAKPIPPVDGKCPTNYKLNECGTLCIPEPKSCEPTPVDGKCPEGYSLTDCGICKLDLIKCGDGTKLNEDTNECIPAITPEPVECEDGFTDVDNRCLPDRYIPYKSVECMVDYVYRKKFGFCKLKITQDDEEEENGD